MIPQNRPLDSLKSLYSFCNQQNCTDGEVPVDNLIEVKGSLYGTTNTGGADNHGTVFAVDPNSGAERVIYSFCGRKNCADGSFPYTGLTNVKGTLYGSAEAGAYGHGVVFAVDPNTGAEEAVYSFCSQQNCTDGYVPTGTMIETAGMLYGTTLYGGANGLGTVFAIEPNTGAETVIYSFCSQPNCADGEAPSAGVIAANGALYGTTDTGGAYNHGAAFAVDPDSGAETVVYSFCRQQNCKDGYYSDAALVDVKGMLYGTTLYGGANNLGTVFALTKR